MSADNSKVNSIVKMSAFQQNKAVKKKTKIKSKFQFSVVSADTKKRIVNDLDVNEMFDCSTALRYKSFLKNSLKINTCVVLVRIIITFPNQGFLELIKL